MEPRQLDRHIGLPLWPAKLLAPVAFSVLCLRLAVLQACAYGKALVLGERNPVAVPLIRDTASQAAAEAEQVGRVTDGTD